MGKYELLRQIGRGGFGRVFVARDHELDRECALKFLLPEHATKPDVLRRFLQEARATARIGHPGIVTIYEATQLEDAADTAASAFIAMELLRGESLALRLQSGPISPRTAIELARQIASAVGAAHDAGIIHRDLKPENTFVVGDPAATLGERVKVLDFGIAKLVEANDDDAHATSSHQVFGSPHYMSPEQCKSSAAVDARSDIYALGVMLFELLAGRLPFEGTRGELVAKHQLEPAPRVRTYAPALPASLDHLVDAMLAKRPDDRPASMREIADRLAYVRDTWSGRAVLPTELEDEPAPGIEASSRVAVTRGATPLADASAATARSSSFRAPAPTILEEAPKRSRRTVIVVSSAIAGVLVVGAIAAMTGGRDQLAARPGKASEEPSKTEEDAVESATSDRPAEDEHRIKAGPPETEDPRAIKLWNDIAHRVNGGDINAARDLLDEYERLFGESPETRSLATQLDAVLEASRTGRGKKSKRSETKD